jgi:hypothetical protein
METARTAGIHTLMRVGMFTECGGLLSGKSTRATGDDESA